MENTSLNKMRSKLLDKLIYYVTYIPIVGMLYLLVALFVPKMQDRELALFERMDAPVSMILIQFASYGLLIVKIIQIMS